MPAPSEKAERLCAMFDSYCKKVLRNACRNERRALAYRRNRESILNEQMQYLFETESHTDQYPSEQFFIQEGDLSCSVFNEKLYRVMLSLTPQQRMVLILDFWYGWTDKRIAQYLKMTPRTVYNLRQRAFQAIRIFLKQKDNRETRL